MSVKQGTLLISSAVCCFDRMLFINKCHGQLLFVNAELSVWEEQYKRLREGLWLMPSSWPDSTATTETTGFVLMCAGFFLFTPLASPFGTDRQEKDGLNWHSPCLRWHFLPPSQFWHLSQTICTWEAICYCLDAQTAEKTPWQGEKTLSWFLSFLQRALPPAFLYAADTEEVVLWASRLHVTSNDCVS